MVRPDWLNLNGPWEFEIDRADTGIERGLRERPLEGTITVPFAPESALSGVEDTDFLHAVWYRRELTVPESWAGRRTLLHFGAVDHDATVWVNGREHGRHRGGFTPFTVDLGHLRGTATVVVRARDSRREPQARGKQSTRHGNYECLYTRTTGIWQTVWAEPVPEVSLARPRLTPDVAGSAFHLEQPLRRSGEGRAGDRAGWTLTATVRDGEGVVAEAGVRADLDLSPRLTLPLPADRVRLWGPEDPYLYDVTITLRDAAGEVVDAVETYAGLRSVSIDGKAVLLNGRPVFQRLVLDQGYYPDGLMTAPSDEALARDIELSLRAGFNGAR
ncbi:glycoside hydrolase family 2 protein, partial [Glycomyces tenuis]